MQPHQAAWMARALALAARGRGHTAPNPMVGSLVVRAGHVVGEGWHRRAGTAHAECLALAAAGRRARGAELYVTLEPCHHTGRTGPCTAVILASGVARVFVATVDPDSRVAGRGIRALRRCGVHVTVGLLRDEALRLNAPYFRAKETGTAYVVAKLAQSLDGCVASRTGASQWITGEQARRRGHLLRSRVDAILVGRGTVLADDPQLTCRLVEGGRDPARVVLASAGDVPLGARVLRAARTSAAPTYVVVGPAASRAQRQALGRAGAHVVAVGAGPGGVNLRQALRALVGLGMHAVLAEGGPTLLGRLLDQGLVQRLHAFVAPKLLGGAAKHSVLGVGTGPLHEAPALVDVLCTRVGNDWLFRGNVAARPPRSR